MGLSADDYLAQQQALLPRGPAWPRDANAMLTALLAAKAEEFARVDHRAESLSIEANPETTAELLADWERVTGLPDNCSGSLRETVQGRRQDLIAKLTSTGGQSVPYFVGMAAAAGFAVSIEEPKPFSAGRSCAGDRLTNGAWIYAWIAHAPASSVIHFRAGLSCAGEPLASWGNSVLECRFNQLKPAHTIVRFAYGYTGLYVLVDDSGKAIVEGTGLALAE